MIHQIDSKNECLFLSVSSAAKFEFVFVLSQKKAFSEKVHFKANRRIFKIAVSFKRTVCLYVATAGNFELFQYFKFETNFLKNENPFQKSGVLFFN